MFFVTTSLVPLLSSESFSADVPTYACSRVCIHREGLPIDLRHARLVKGQIVVQQNGNLMITLWRQVDCATDDNLQAPHKLLVLKKVISSENIIP